MSGVYFELDDVGSGSTSDAYATSSFPFEGSCRIEACVFAVYRGAEGPTPLVGQSAPLDFAPPPELTISPTTGLHAGDPIAAIAENLVPGGTYDWAVCADAACDGGEVLHADTDGRLAFTAPASPYTHSGVPYGYCRDDCRVEVHGIGTDNRSPSVSATYAVAAGTVTATPSTGLADGQAVQVEGTDLVRTYEGPTLWIFPTGGWALTQCDRTGSTTSRWAGCSSTAPPDRRPGA